MDKVIIDTNILYSLVGLSENKKINNDLGSKYELWTTTANLIEGIVRHRNDLDSIKRILHPVLNQDIKLIGIDRAPLSNEIILRLMQATSINTISNEVTEILKLKINREAEYLRLIFIIVIAGYFDLLKETEDYGFTNSDKKNIQLYLIRIQLESYSAVVLEYFKEKIAEGYDCGHEQRVVLEAFHDMILASLNIFLFNFHQIKSGIISTKGICDNVENITELKQSLSRDAFYKKLIKHLDNPISIISKKKKYDFIDSYIEQMKRHFMNKERLTDKPLEFLMNKIEKAYKEKSKIRKNDIFDCLIVSCLGLSDFKIITLDQVFIDLLKNVDRDSWELIHELGFAKQS